MGKGKSEAFNEAVVGVFMVVVVLLLAYFTIVISGVDIVRGDQRVTLRVVFDQVGGLKNHDNVMYRGTKVGKVEHVEVTTSNLVVHASVDRNVILRESCRISVRNLSMLGGNFMMLEEGSGARLPLEGTLFRGDAPSDWMQDVSSVAQNLRRLTEMSEVRVIVTNVAAVSQKANVFMDRMQTIANRAESVVTRIERGEGTVGKLLSTNDAVYVDLRRLMTNAVAVTEKINTGRGTLGRLIADDGVLYNDLSGGVASLRVTAENIRTNVDFKAIGVAMTDIAGEGRLLVSNLNAVAARVNEGKGTLGRLVEDEGLYRETEGLIKDARQVLDNYRDTTPITTFSSLATGAL